MNPPATPPRRDSRLVAVARFGSILFALAFLVAYVLNAAGVVSLFGQDAPTPKAAEGAGAIPAPSAPVAAVPPANPAPTTVLPSSKSMAIGQPFQPPPSATTPVTVPIPPSLHDIISKPAPAATAPAAVPVAPALTTSPPPATVLPGSKSAIVFKSEAGSPPPKPASPPVVLPSSKSLTLMQVAPQPPAPPAASSIVVLPGSKSAPIFKEPPAPANPPASTGK